MPSTKAAPVSGESTAMPAPLAARAAGAAASVPVDARPGPLPDPPPDPPLDSPLDSPLDPPLDPPTLRVAIQQPSLPAYRVPVFRALAADPALDLSVHYGSEEPALANAAPDGFEGRCTPFARVAPGRGPGLMWHAAQWRLVDGRRADVAILCWNARFVSLWAALLRARLNGVPVALWGHGYSKTGTSRLRDAVRRLPARLARAVVVYDERTAAALVDAGYEPARVFVAANGLDGQAIAAAREAARRAPDRLAWRAAHDVAAGPVLISVGRVFADNRLDVAVEALPRLAARHPDVRLVVVGGGDAEELARLAARAEALGVGTRLRLAGPLYDEAELARWMDAADVFVYPRNVGLSLIHAFNHALPAVVAAPRSAHNPEIAVLEDGVNGRLAESLDAGSFADAVAAILAEPTRHAAMREAALASVRDTHNLDSVTAAFRRLVDFLAGERRARTPRRRAGG